jgi:hypothetical protein
LAVRADGIERRERAFDGDPDVLPFLCLNGAGDSHQGQSRDGGLLNDTHLHSL